jgi:hypothetical protein
MAFVNLPTASLKFTFRDASGSMGFMKIDVPYDTLASEAIIAATGIRTAMLALSDATVIGQSLTYSYFDDAPPAANAGSRVEEKGEFVWRTANGRSTRFSIPAVKDTVLTTSGAVDRANVLVTALDAVVVGANSIFCAADGSDITSLLHAYQRFNSSSKKQLPGDR